MKWARRHCKLTQFITLNTPRDSIDAKWPPFVFTFSHALKTKLMPQKDTNGNLYFRFLKGQLNKGLHTQKGKQGLCYFRLQTTNVSHYMYTIGKV